MEVALLRLGLQDVIDRVGEGDIGDGVWVRPAWMEREGSVVKQSVM